MVTGGNVTVRWPDRLASIAAVRFIVWVSVVAFSHQGVLSDPFRVAEWMDDHQFLSWEESDRMTLLHYHQLPAWNPWWCGGTVGIAGPEDPFFGPDFLLRLLFGVSHGRRLAVMLLVVLGFEGMYRLCRRLDSSAIAAGFAAIAYGTCDRFVSYLHDGWVNFMGFELIPFVLYFLVEGTWGPALDPGAAVDEAARRRRMLRARVLGGFFVAWIILSAGTYPTPYAIISVGYLTIALSLFGFFRGARDPVPEVVAGEPRWRALLREPWLLPWISATVLGLAAFVFAAGKLLPTLSLLRQFPRVFTQIETHGAPEMFTAFWPRYAIVVVLGLVGALTADAAAGIFLGGAMLFFALSMGDSGEGSLFHLMQSLPIVGQLRFPDRFMVGVLLFASVAASRGITRLEDALPAAMKRVWELVYGWKLRLFGGKEEPYPREMGWLMVGAAAFLAFSKLVRPNLEEILPGVHIRPGTMYVQEAARFYDGPFRQSRGNRRDVHVFTRLNLGSLYCVAGNPLPESALLRGDLEQEEYPEDPDKATVKQIAWTPNEITLEVDAKTDTTIRINQNWAPQWTASVGRVKNVEKLLAVDVPAGKNIVVVAYKDRFLDLCLLISLAGLAGTAWLFGRDARRWLLAERTRWASLPAWPPRGGEPELEGPPEPPRD